MRPREVSPYKLNLFLQCPRQYYFEYLDPEIVPIKKQIKKKRPELELGNFIHDSLTLFFKRPATERNWQMMSDILKKNWNGPRGKTAGFQSLQEERNYYLEAQTMLKRFVERENLNPSIFALPDSPPGRSFGDYKKISFAENLDLGGKIDRIDSAPDDSLEIIDYKTGKEKEDGFQLIIYTFLAEGLFNKPVSKASYLYLKTGNWQTIIPEEIIRCENRKKILKIVDQIAAESDWRPAVSRLCAFCDYIDYCPAKEKIKELLGYSIKN